jgi:hypothetical protein
MWRRSFVCVGLALALCACSDDEREKVLLPEDVDFCDHEQARAALDQGVFPEEGSDCECFGESYTFSTEQCPSNTWSCEVVGVGWNAYYGCFPQDAG